MLPGGRAGDFIIVAAIALIVVGPKDLPKLLRQLGRFVGKMRAMADDFRASFEDMARQSELDELRKEVEAMRAQNVPVLGDIQSEMRALDSDVRNHMLDTPKPVDMPAATPADEVLTPHTVEPLPGDPQMEGLPPPPKAETLPDMPEKPAPKPRKPRAPKVAVEPAAADVAEPVVIKRAPRTRAGKAAS